jgi:alkyl hydroperoxide reductase subunit AhpC
MWRVHELSKMLPDGGGMVGAMHGVYDEAAGVDIRGRFIIDADFVIRAMEVLPPEAGRNPDELLRQVKEFQHVMKTDEVIRSGWQPGQLTLKPGPDLVGKVREFWKP